MSEAIRWTFVGAWLCYLMLILAAGFLWATHSWPFNKFAKRWEKYMEEKYGGTWHF